jgi:PBP4 family serine-type D-alanyl-D-alanine carboxypeptidase
MRKAIGVVLAVLLPAALAAGAGDLEDELASRLDRVRRSLRLDRAIGLSVASLTTGQVIYTHNAAKSYVPASGMKLVTMAAVLHYLGPHFRFSTRVVTDGRLEGGVLRGNLIVIGGGDPALGEEALDEIAQRLVESGIADVEGAILVDDFLFDDAEKGPEAYGETLAKGRPFLSALSYNKNLVELTALPGPSAGESAVLLDSGHGYFEVENRVKTSVSGRSWLRISRLRGQAKVVAYGRARRGDEEGARAGWVAPEPAVYLGHALAAKLSERGTIVRGAIERRRADPASLASLYTYRSPTLMQILQSLGKDSNNFVAEVVLKTLGAHRWGGVGSFESGARALAEYLTGLGFREDSFQVLDGSGLSYDNRLSAEMLTRILSELYRSDLRSEFLCSLALAGVDGTLKRRLQDSEAMGLVMAKTGSLAGISSLSGVAFSPTRGPLVFSILINGIGKQWRGDQAEDAIARALLAP